MSADSNGIRAYCSACQPTNRNTIKVYGGYDGTAVLRTYDDPAWEIMTTENISWYFGPGSNEKWDFYWVKGKLPPWTSGSVNIQMVESNHEL